MEWWPNHTEVYFAVEKAFIGSHKTEWGQIQQVFSWMLVTTADKWLNTWWLFCILTYSTTSLTISVKVSNVNMNFVVQINECLLTQNMYSVFCTSAYVFHSSVAKFGAFLCATQYYYVGGVVIILDVGPCVAQQQRPTTSSISSTGPMDWKKAGKTGIRYIQHKSTLYLSNGCQMTWLPKTLVGL